MKKMTSNEIRNTWLNFFKSKLHAVEPGASLVPNNDPTLLWINAGVAALKKYFDGSVIPQNPRICNVQKAIRTNDIENVGHTARHHTFFEMMGNFSIGDYFRDEVIPYAYELLNDEKYFGIPMEKLYITYHPDDTATYNKWIELGVHSDHLIPCLGNFWEIGEGPCGPDTEIFFDRGIKYDPDNIGPRMIAEDIENDRYIEIWNIVFSQYNSKPNMDRKDYPELPHKNIDTGAGLERFACILQEAETNYETDLFMPIIKKCEHLSSLKYEGKNKTSFKIIADHLRTCTFALADGAVFSNEGRGYVLRRLLRRAVRHGKKLNIQGKFMSLLVDEVIEIMKEFYPYLLEKSNYIKDLITKEEEKFLLTLNDGEKRLEDLYLKNKVITGEDAFILYDTYGFPFELTLEFAQEKGLNINKDDFDSAMKKQKELARSNRGNKNSMKSQNQEYMDYHENSIFVGYNTLKTESTIIKIFNSNDEIFVVLDKTPFYAEMGGEVADTGSLISDDFRADVLDTQKMPNGQHIHKLGVISGKVIEGMKVEAYVNEYKRHLIEANHSATHLLHQALKDVLGNHVNQHGSQVSEQNIRFDFNHFENINSEQLLRIEKIVKNKINEGLTVNTYITTLQEAKNANVTALFDEKYGDNVRVVDMTYSKELCGGCHINNTKNIVDFAISSVESKGSGIFRIIAVTSSSSLSNLLELNENIVNEFNGAKEKLNSLKEELNRENIDVSKYENVRIELLPSYQTIINLRIGLELIKNQSKSLEKLSKDLKEKEMLNKINDLNVNINEVNGIKYILQKTSLENIDLVKKTADNLADKNKDCLIILINTYDDKLVFVAKRGILVSPNVHCGNIVKTMAQICAGNGGGRPDMAQAGGKDISKVNEVISKIGEII